MKSSFTLLSLCISLNALQAQNVTNSTYDSLRLEAIRIGIDSVDIPGYIHFHTSINNHDHNVNRSPVNTTPTVQSFGNPGFESGDFTSFQGAIGDNTNSSFGPLQNIQSGFFNSAVDPAYNDLYARHSIITPGYGTDVEGSFPGCPSGYGNYTARLGNAYGNYQGQILEQSWLVGSTDTNFVFSYAVVMYDGSHQSSEACYFEYELVDSAGNVLQSRFDHSDALPPSYVAAQSFATKYLPWTLDTLDLSGLQGTNVTLRFTVAGCIYGGHYAYCYLDLDPNNANTTAINDTEPGAVKVYPNPSLDGIVHIELPNAVTSEEFPLIYDINGNQVPATVSRNTNGWTIDMSSLSSGVYFINTVVQGESFHSRIVR